MPIRKVLTKIHPLTSAGACLVVLGVGLWSFGQFIPAVLAITIAYGFGLLEFQKYTSRFQFALLLTSGLCLGMALDILAGTALPHTLLMLLCAVAIIVRQLFLQRLTLVKYLWLELALVAIAWGIFATSSIGRPFQWETMLLPLIGLLPSTVLAVAYAVDGRVILRRVSHGYRIKIGEAAPEFELPDQEGRSVRLSDYRGAPVLLVFIRGDWCPGCHIMLRTYEKGRLRFLEKGVQVLGIGPDSVDVNKDMMERLGVGYNMLSDPGQHIASHYGVAYSNPMLESVINYDEGIPLPASFLLDGEGIVRYVSRPDRVGEFLDPSLIFGVLDQLPAVSAPAWKAA